MRAMLIKGNLEEYELVTSEEIQPGFVTSREIVPLVIRTAIPAYICEDSEDFEDHIKRQFLIYSEETMIISKKYTEYSNLGTQLDMECEQPRYFVEIDRETVKYGELILTEEFGYCLLLEVSSSIFGGVIESICVQEMGALKPTRKTTRAQLISDAPSFSIGSSVSEYDRRVRDIINSAPWRSIIE